MATTSDFLLERVVHQVLKGDPAAGRGVVAEALGAGMTAAGLISDIFWPAMECVQQLHEDGTITTRIQNTALRALRSLLDGVRLEREPENGRSVFVLTTPGERAELGAHMIATLAEAYGWRVFFAGAGLTLEELAFSIGQLGPEVILIQGTLSGSVAATRELIGQLRRIRVWPSAQLVVAGGVASNEIGADLMGKNVLETLELMAMWPEYRSKMDVKGAKKGDSLGMLEGSTGAAGVSAEFVQAMMEKHFGKRATHPN